MYECKQRFIEREHEDIEVAKLSEKEAFFEPKTMHHRSTHNVIETHQQANQIHQPLLQHANKQI